MSDAKVVKRLPNLVHTDDGRIVIKNGRLSYPHLFEPWAKDEFDENGRPTKKKFSGSILLPNDTHKEEILYLRKLMQTMAVEKWKGKLPPERYCIRDGETQNGEEYEGCWYVVASNDPKRPPQLVNRDPSEKVTEEMRKLYPGAFVNFMVKLWVQDHKTGGKRINANLLVVQYVKKGTEFGEGSVDAGKVMDDISGEFPDDDEALENMGLDENEEEEDDGLGL